MAIYYCDTASSGGDGTTQAITGAQAAFQHIAEVNAASFAAGDSILFKKGCTWRETLTVPRSGAAGTPMIFGAYGSGAAPIIDGSNLITPGTSWTAATIVAVAEEQTTTNTETPIKRAADGYLEGQGVKSDADIVVPYIDIWIKKVGTPVGNIWIDIWATTGTPARPTGAGPVFTTNTIDAATISTTASWVRFTFASPPTFTAGTIYFMVPDASYGDSSTNCINWNINTIESYRGADPYRHELLTGAHPPVHVWGSDTQDMTFTIYKTSTSTTIWTAAVTTEPNIVFFNGTKGTKVASQAACIATGNWYWAANVLSVYSASDPDTAYTSPGIEVGARNTAITTAKDYITFDGITARRGNSATLGTILITGIHNTVQNSTVSGSAHHGIAGATTSADTLINGNTITDCGRIGGDCGAVFFYKDAAAAGHENIVRNNTISSNLRFGIYLVSNYCIVENNTLSGNGNTTDACVGIEIFNGDDDSYGANNIIRYNSVTGQKSGGDNGEGIDCDDFSDSNQVYYNICYGNDGPGFTNWRSTNNVFYNNVSYGNCLNSGGALSSKYEFHVGETNNNEVTGLVIKNNILVATQANTYAIGIVGTTFDNAGLAITNNIYYATAANWYFWNATAGATLATWNALTGVGTDLNSDPLFVSATDFHLQAGSPAINAGVDVSLTSDYAGNPIRGSFPDIGAYEWYPRKEGTKGYRYDDNKPYKSGNY